ncbi:MAG TPA: purine-nucleoside phosphorylase [Saprospiraceae bacterium]|nr:purine-nucleoside phosphorylase [Saprospiraceae bacterium]HMP23478.1 purine-nucleoside phosphorylase [Saprospiraceae bacterium]
MHYEQIQEALAFIRQKTDFQPVAGIILGTGLGNLANEITAVAIIPYHDIPHFPVSTVQSHKGQLIFGHLAGQPVAAMSGRFHYYEGYSMQQVTFPVRVMKCLGIERLFISNAAGGTSQHFRAGDIVFVKDHINFQPENPLRGENDERLGPRFPDMLHTYDRTMNARALAIAQAHGIRAHEGVYVGLQGPNLETPAEYQFVHRIGGDLVGMSTIPEVLVAKHSGLRVFVLSVVTNQCFPLEEIRETTVEDVIAVAQAAEPRMTLIVKELLREMPA